MKMETEAFLSEYAMAEAQEYSPAVEYLELMTRQGIAAVDTQTGDIISAFDPEIPCEQKAEAVAFLLDTLSYQRLAIKDRVKALKEKDERIELLEDRIREAFKQQMINEGLTKIKTLENTWYFMNKPKLEYNLEFIPEEKCEVELKGKITGTLAQKLKQEYSELKLDIVKKKPLEFYIPELKEEGLLKETTNTILCKR